MCEVLELLAHALQEFPGVQPIFLLDTAIMHISDVVADKAAALNIWLVPVPPRLTHVLQPGNVHTLAGYNKFVRNAFRKACASSADGKILPRTWLEILFEACAKYFNGPQVGPSSLTSGLGQSCCQRQPGTAAYLPHRPA